MGKTIPKKIGLFGGTFDPVHNGHLSIAESFLNSGCIDELWVLLTPYPPHKPGNGNTPYQIRLSMLEAAFFGIPGITISTIENDLPKPSFTVNTIRYLKSRYLEHHFFFCMGEDSLSQFHTWKYYKEILEEAHLLVADRPGADHKNVEQDILNKTTFVEHTPLAVSSSSVREALKSGKDVFSDVPEKVLLIIEKEHLYK